jgi:16S rRNA (uracil1498-N3)-methyltransferase
MGNSAAARFFVDKKDLGSTAFLRGENHRHLSYSLRAKTGDRIILCDGEGNEYLCRIEQITKEYTSAAIEDVCRSVSEPSIRVCLYQCLPKGDKMEYIIEKAVELGASRIVPVLSSRCVSRPDAAALEKKTARWRAICHSAAKQAGRGIIPEVGHSVDFKTALEQMRESEGRILFYEQSDGRGLEQLVLDASSIAILIGPEGGFSEEEAEAARLSGVSLQSLGKRILRCETAPVSAISVIMHITGNL